MERKGSFSPRNAKNSSSDHNNRIAGYVPFYCIRTSVDNIYRKYLGYKSDSQYLDEAKLRYTEKNAQHQNMQSRQVVAFYKEAVLSLEKHHTEKDVLQVFENLQEKMEGHHLLEMTIHKDEGHFVRTEEGWDNLTYYPNEDILKKEDGNWYIMRDETKSSKNLDNFDIKADMKKFKMILNIHAHAKYTMFNMQTGKSDKLKHYQTKQRLKIVCDSLGMRYEPREAKKQGNSSAEEKRKHKIRRMEKYHNIQIAFDRGITFQQQMTEVQSLADKQLIAKDVEIEGLRAKLEKKGKISIVDLNRMKAEYRQQMINACEVYSPTAYRALNRLYNEAKELNKSKNLDINKLQKETTNLLNSIGEKNPKIENLENAIKIEESRNKEAQVKVVVLEEQVVALTAANISKDTSIFSAEALIKEKVKKIEVLEEKVRVAAVLDTTQKSKISKLENQDPVIKEIIKVVKVENSINEKLKKLAYMPKGSYGRVDATYQEIVKELEEYTTELKKEKSKLLQIINTLKNEVKNYKSVLENLSGSKINNLLSYPSSLKQKSELELAQERISELENLYIEEQPLKIK